jgi:hypothetical protein
MMQTRYTMAMSWLLVLACVAFALNSGTSVSKASSSDDLKTILSMANMVTGQTGGSQLIQQMNSSTQEPVQAITPGVVNSARSNIDRYLEVASRIDPRLGQLLQRSCSDKGQDPIELEKMIRRYGHGLVALAELQSTDPDLYESKIEELSLDAEVMQLSIELKQIIKASGPDSSEVMVHLQLLQAAMRARLELSIENRERSIMRLNERVEQLQERVEYDEEHFEQELDRQMSQAMGELDAVRAARGR